jgi:cyclic pyranopterin phosphate synthase
MNDVDFPVREVLAGIDAAQAAGLGPIKVNMVVKRGTNDHEILPMARHFRGRGITLRFIEFMDVGATNGWRMDEVLPGAEVIRRLQAEFRWCRCSRRAGRDRRALGLCGADGRHDPALGEVGVICSVTHPFCGDCNRAPVHRGRLFLCLFATQGTTCAACCAAAPATRRSARPSPASGTAAATATASCAPACRPTRTRRRRGWR